MLLRARELLHEVDGLVSVYDVFVAQCGLPRMLARAHALFNEGRLRHNVAQKAPGSSLVRVRVRVRVRFRVRVTLTLTQRRKRVGVRVKC